MMRLGLGTRRKSRPDPFPADRFRPGLEALEVRWVPAVDVILEWNAVMLQANAVDHTPGPGQAPQQGGPTLTARAFAMASAAMYDAYNSIENIGQRYLIDVNETRPASSDAAVAKAARDVLAFLYPRQQATFDTALAQTLARIPDGVVETRGVAVGRTVAAAVLNARANDNSATIGDPPYVPNGRPGFHNVDPRAPGQGFYAPDYQSVTPFVLANGDQVQARRLDDGTPQGRLQFMRSLEYTAAYYEVLLLGGDGVTTPTLRTADQTEAGIYWGYDGARGLGTPPRLYNQIVRTVAAQQGNTEAENARLFALVNLAMHDAGIVAWNAKYDNAFWRPILGIRGGGGDGNPFTIGLPGWTPLGAPASNAPPGSLNLTPNFPAYTSGHATFGGATFQTLARFYGTDNIAFTFVSDEFNGVTRDNNGNVRPLRPRSFSSFSQASEENGQSRIYLGIHWAFDKTEGIRTGNRVANFTFNNFLRPNGTGAGTDTLTAADAGGFLPVTAATAGTTIMVVPGVTFTTTSPAPAGGTGGFETGPVATDGTTTGETDGSGGTGPVLQVSGTSADTLAVLDQLFPDDRLARLP
jgi:hypothetical protein